VRIERRKIGSSEELITLVTEALEGEVKGFRVVDQAHFAPGEIELGLLAYDAEGKVYVVVAKEEAGDSLILSYGKHVAWLRSNKERLSKENPQVDWSVEPGIIMLAESFSPHVLLLAGMLAVPVRMCYSFKCLGIGKDKGLYMETIGLPKAEVAVKPVTEGVDLLSSTISSVVEIAEDLSVSASFGYLSKSLDWIPVANLRSHRGTIWIESGPGTWSAKRIEDHDSLADVLSKVKQSYEEVLKTKGEAKNLSEEELSEAERKSLKWE
jgi:hypothetical protein